MKHINLNVTSPLLKSLITATILDSCTGYSYIDNVKGVTDEEPTKNRIAGLSVINYIVSLYVHSSH